MTVEKETSQTSTLSPLRRRFPFAVPKGGRLLIYYTYAHVVGSVSPFQCAPWLGLELGPLARTYTREHRRV